MLNIGVERTLSLCQWSGKASDAAARKKSNFRFAHSFQRLNINKTQSERETEKSNNPSKIISLIR